jgi:hypothetical protein
MDCITSNCFQIFSRNTELLLENKLNKLELKRLEDRLTLLAEEKQECKLKEILDKLEAKHLEAKLALLTEEKQERKLNDLLDEKITVLLEEKKSISHNIRNMNLNFAIRKESNSANPEVNSKPEPKTSPIEAKANPAQNEIIFYSEENFSGQTYHYKAGDTFDFTDGPHLLNDVFKSVKIVGPEYKVTIFSDGGYKGPKQVILEDVAKIDVPNNGISSFIVTYKTIEEKKKK